MKRTVWDRIEHVDVATALDSTGWEGEDAPTNVAPPAFAKAGNGGFWKGVLVGVGASAMLAGIVTVGGVVIVVAAYGLPIARTVEVAAPARLPVVEEPKAPVVAAVEPVATPAIAKVEPVATPAPAPKVVARTKPETKRAPVPVAPPPAHVAKVVATPAPEPKRPNREELLQLALAAKQTRAAPAPTPTPAPAPKWEEPETKQDDVAAADEKWVPVDDTEATSTTTDSSSDELSKMLGP